MCWAAAYHPWGIGPWATWVSAEGTTRGQKTWLSFLALLLLSFVTVNKLPIISNLDFLSEIQRIRTCNAPLPPPPAEIVLKINLYDDARNHASGPGKPDANKYKAALLLKGIF